MLEIAGGILIAVAALAVGLAALRYIVLAISAAFCLAITVAAWMFLSSGLGGWWAAIGLAAGFSIWVWSANRKPPVAKGEHASPDRLAHAPQQRRQVNGETPAAYELNAWKQRQRIARWSRLTPAQKRKLDDPSWWSD